VNTSSPAVPTRRPPAPEEPLATVTRLCPGGTAPEDVPLASVQGTLALDLGVAPPQPATPDLQVVENPGGHAEGHGDGHGEVRLWAARFAQATVEVLGGDRPVTQLLRWTDARVYQELDRRVKILAQTAAAPQRMRTIRPQVRSVRVCRPAAQAAEVSVHVRYGQRSRAIAARLERRQERWTCVALQLG
jgi:hypothetical protein